MKNVLVRLHRGQLAYFRRKARESQNEQYAMLVGRHISSSVVEIHYFDYPKLEESTPECVTPDQEAFDAVLETAAKRGLVCVGTIHSHPNWTPVMSPDDHKGHVVDGDRISGVVGVLNGKTYINFWRADSSLPCKIEYIVRPQAENSSTNITEL